MAGFISASRHLDLAKDILKVLPNAHHEDLSKVHSNGLFRSIFDGDLSLVRWVPGVFRLSTKRGFLCFGKRQSTDFYGLRTSRHEFLCFAPSIATDHVFSPARANGGPSE
jgi:hypothetical protein